LVDGALLKVFKTDFSDDDPHLLPADRIVDLIPVFELDGVKDAALSGNYVYYVKNDSKIYRETIG
jgi:hypothetical protein